MSDSTLIASTGADSSVEPLSSFEANAALTYIERVAEVAARTGQPYLATVVAEADGQVQITRAGDDAWDDETYARVAGFGVLTNDLVLVVDVGGKEPIVIGRVEAAAPSYHIQRHNLRFWSGADLSGYADAGATEKWSIDGATGAAVFGSVNTPIPIFQAQTSSDTASTTSTATYQQALSESVVLPAGTWTISAAGFLDCLHSASNRVQVGVEIDGTITGAQSPSAPSASPNYRTVKAEQVASGIAGGRTVTVRVMFRSLDAGTTTANNPMVIGTARRTA